MQGNTKGKQLEHIAASLICEPTLIPQVASSFGKFKIWFWTTKILGGLEMRGKSKQRFRALSLAGAA
jgi:hypothetical protein